MNWFYESAGQQQGPVPEHELDRLLAEGKITPETLVWREGLPDWQPLRIARPGASTPPPMPSGGAAGEVPPGYVRCSLTGKIIPESEAIYIQGKPYSAEAKPQVLHSLQSGGILPTSDENRTGPAWERRQELGLLAAAWETIKAVLMQPSATFSNMKREGGVGTPLAFYMLVSTLALIFFQICLFAVTLTGVGTPESQAALANQPKSVTELLLTFILIPIQILVGIFIQSGVTHVSLMICGGARRPFEATFRTLCYAGGAASVLFFIPICGWPAAGIWGLVAQCIGLARVHEISTGRAVLAVFLPLLICCALAFGAAMLLGAFASQSGALAQ